MTVGDGIFWSTVVIVFFAALYQISVRKKWKLLGKVLGFLMLIGSVTGGVVWAWIKYQDRPYVVEELADIRLGMRPVDVMLAKGEAVNSTSEPFLREDGRYQLSWIYDPDEYSDRLEYVIFYGDAEDQLRAGIVCESGGFGSLMGISIGSPEKRVIDLLGEPSRTSIDSGGLMKLISYERWQISYKIEKGKVTQLCIAGRGPMVFDEEYGETESALEALQRPDNVPETP